MIVDNPPSPGKPSQNNGENAVFACVRVFQVITSQDKSQIRCQNRDLYVVEIQPTCFVPRVIGLVTL